MTPLDYTLREGLLANENRQVTNVELSLLLPQDVSRRPTMASAWLWNRSMKVA